MTKHVGNDNCHVFNISWRHSSNKGIDFYLTATAMCSILAEGIALTNMGIDFYLTATVAY